MKKIFSKEGVNFEAQSPHFGHSPHRGIPLLLPQRGKLESNNE